MQLSEEEKEILQGKKGETMKKALKSVVLYGEIFGAKRLIPIKSPIHLVTSFGMFGLDTVYEMIDELIDSNLKTQYNFTVDPKPIDFENVECSETQKKIFNTIYSNQKRYEKQLSKLGLKDEKSFTCTCYMPEVGNVPKQGEILSWAESSAVVFANSVLGAKTNRNSGIIELLCGIVGKVPEFGFITDEGRKAKWLIEIKTKNLPNAQVLGSAIGKKVMEDVPYIVGLDSLLNLNTKNSKMDYLKDMGAATASNGAVGLYHVENLTPEALEQGKNLLIKDYKTYVIDETIIKDTMNSYPILWEDKNSIPEICFIGCPHLSLNQIYEWNSKISKRLKEKKEKKVTIRTILSAAPDVINKFKEDKKSYKKMLDNGLKLTYICPLMYMNNPECSKQAIVTNSNKLRTYSTARFYLDEEIIDIITTHQGGKYNA